MSLDKSAQTHILGGLIESALSKLVQEVVLEARL